MQSLCISLNDISDCFVSVFHQRAIKWCKNCLVLKGLSFSAYSAPLAACDLCVWLCTHNYLQLSECCCSQISGGNYTELNIREPQLEAAEEYLRIVMLQNSWQKKGEGCSREPGQVILPQVMNLRLGGLAWSSKTVSEVQKIPPVYGHGCAEDALMISGNESPSHRSTKFPLGVFCKLLMPSSHSCASIVVLGLPGGN